MKVTRASWKKVGKVWGKGEGKGKKIKPKIEIIPGTTAESGETLQQINIS